VHGDAGNLEPNPELEAGQEVRVHGMHASVAHQAGQVQRAPGCPERRAQLEKGREAEELTARNVLGDPHQILGNHAAGAEIQMTHFAVAHLSLGESYRETAGVEERAGRGIPQTVPDRSVAELDGVALAFRAVSPAIQDHQGHGRAARWAV